MRVKVFLALVCLTLSAAMAGAQVPTGTISGRVTDSSGGVLPGVTVTATSPNLQGPRVIVTSAFGDYTLPLLPPGSYTVTFELSGFQTSTQQVDVASTESVPLDVQLGVGGIETRVTVVGEARSFVATVQTGTNIRQSLMSTLPSSRTLTAALAAGAPVRVERTATFIDGIGGMGVLEEMWPLVSTLLAGAMVSSVAEIADAVRMIAERARVVAEGAGAAALAAALRHRVEGKVVCVVSGGNIDTARLATILQGEVPA